MALVPILFFILVFVNKDMYSISSASSSSLVIMSMLSVVEVSGGLYLWTDLEAKSKPVVGTCSRIPTDSRTMPTQTTSSTSSSQRQLQRQSQRQRQWEREKQVDHASLNHFVSTLITFPLNSISAPNPARYHGLENIANWLLGEILTEILLSESFICCCSAVKPRAPDPLIWKGVDADQGR